MDRTLVCSCLHPTIGMSPPDDTVGGELKGPIRDTGVMRTGLQLTI
jgi:hypothetical protein